jgi:hypothetical protein
MLLEFLLSHEDVTALDWVFQSWDQVVASTIKNYFGKTGLNKDVAKPKQDDRSTQDQEEIFYLARATKIKVEEETIIEDISAFDTLDDGWEEVILSAP